MSTPLARDVANEPGMPSVAELRRRLGGDLSDEELLLRATMPAEQVDAMKAVGPAERHYEPGAASAMKLIRALLARTDLAHVEIEKPGFRLELTR